MGLNVSQKERLDTFDQPRHLTQSEIASLRRDAISTSTAMKAILLERQNRQKWSVARLLRKDQSLKVAAE